jgi:hypothetical protein
MGKRASGFALFVWCGVLLFASATLGIEAVALDDSGAVSRMTGRGSSWTDQFDETTYTISAPDTVGVGDSVHVIVTARDPYYPDDMVAAPWSFRVDGETEDSGFWVSLSDTTWEASYDFTFDSEGSHVFLFTAQDLGHGNGGHSYEWFEIDVTTVVTDPTSDLDDLASGPPHFGIATSFPNPFGIETTIRYVLSEAAEVTVQVYDASGRLVRVLTERSFVDAGIHQVVWDGTDEIGQRVRSGVYFCRVQAGVDCSHRRVISLR